MTPGESPDRSYKWLVVGMLWFVCFFNYADRQAIFAVFPLIKQQLGLTDFQLGIVGAAFMWMYALFGPLAGWLCDRLPRKSLVLGGLIAWSLVTALTAVCHTYGQLVLCRALSGLGEAVYLPASMSLIGDYHAASHTLSRHVPSPVKRLCRLDRGRSDLRSRRPVLWLAMEFPSLRILRTSVWLWWWESSSWNPRGKSSTSLPAPAATCSMN